MTNRLKTPNPAPAPPKAPTNVQEETLKRLDVLTSQKSDRSAEQREQSTVERLRRIS
jgi:hypothetical protein